METPKQAAHEELPALDDFGCDWEDSAGAVLRTFARDNKSTQSNASLVLVEHLSQREWQLREALRTLKERDAEIARLHLLEIKQFTRAESLEAEVARLKEQLEEKSTRVRLLRIAHEQQVHQIFDLTQRESPESAWERGIRHGFRGCQDFFRSLGELLGNSPYQPPTKGDAR